MFDKDYMIERVEDLAKEKDMSVAKVLKACGLGKDTLLHIKNGSSPSIDKVIKLALFFDVSIDSLVRKKEDRSLQEDTQISDDEDREKETIIKETVDMIRHLTAENKKIAFEYLNYLKYLASKENK